MSEQSLAQSTRNEQERDQRKSGEQRERQGRRDYLYDALAAMPLEQRVETIHRMAERMGV